MVPFAAMSSAMSVAGLCRAGDAALPDVGLEEQGHGLLDGGDGVAGGAVVAVQGGVEQARPELGGVWVAAQDFAGVAGLARVGDPLQDVVQGAAGQGGGVEVGLDHLGGFGGVEPGGVVAVGGRATLDGAGGEGFGAAFGDHRVDATVDRVPHQGGEAGGQPERVQHRDRAVFGAAGDGQQQVIGLGQGDQRGTGRRQQRRGEQIQGLAGTLRADHPGGPVPRAPQLTSVGLPRLPDPPTDLFRVKPSHLVPPQSGLGEVVCRRGRGGRSGGPDTAADDRAAVRLRWGWQRP